MQTGYINWEGDWDHCYTIWPKDSKIKWCPKHQMYHDIGCFLSYKSGALKCYIDAASRPWKADRS